MLGSMKKQNTIIETKIVKLFLLTAFIALFIKGESNNKHT